MSAHKVWYSAGSAFAIVSLIGLTANGNPQVLARDRVALSKVARLNVTSQAFRSDHQIPTPYSQDGENFSPSLAWQGSPAETRSFVVMVEDPDAVEPKPFVHWLLYNVPPHVTRLHESIPALPQLPDLARSSQGRNSRGTIGYAGPRPPYGDPAHHYYFQVFAVDVALTLDPGASREALLAAMHGHVLAAGDVVGLFKRP
jgi:Raf kinase inhibitor-like YbhB/YbcL family protein